MPFRWFKLFVFLLPFVWAGAKNVSAQETITLIPPLPIEETEQSSGPLSAVDAELYTRIFNYIDDGEIAEAEKLFPLLQDDLLMGYVQAEIFDTKKDSEIPKKQIEVWLKKYADLPPAAEIYDRAQRMHVRRPRNRPTDPAAHMSAGSCTSMRIADPIDLVLFKYVRYVPKEHRKKVRWSMLMFSAAIRNGKTLAAKLHLNEKHVKKYLSRNDRDDALTALAFAYFIDLEDEKAWETIQEPLSRSAKRNPLAPWVAGIVAWRLKDYENAEINFKKVANHPKSIPTLKSAGAYWATRALMKNDKYYEVNEYLRQAALSSPRSFYGLLAQRALGWSIGHSWKRPEVEKVDTAAVLEQKGGKRAAALIQIGQMDAAEKELIKLYAEKKSLRKQLIAYAETIEEYPDLAVRLTGLSGEIETPDGDSALYPYPNWTPSNGWQVDRALIYAFVRQESCFKNRAFSKAGARGVMQLMPSTARLMAKRLGKRYQLSRLHRIPYNLMLGQELVRTLLNNKAINGNLLMAIAAYNCGPRNSVRWQKRKDFVNDPLMFVEGIPSRETRGFVKKVMANYWIYRSLFNKDLSSIDDILQGKYPRYHPE